MPCAFYIDCFLNLEMNGDETPLSVNGDDCQPTQNYNDEHRKHARLTLDSIQTRKTVDRSTSTGDTRGNQRDQITTTEDLFVDNHGIKENAKRRENNFDKFVNKDEDKSACGEKRMAGSLKQSRELFKTKSSPSIMKGISGILIRRRPVFPLLTFLGACNLVQRGSKQGFYTRDTKGILY